MRLIVRIVACVIALSQLAYAVEIVSVSQFPGRDRLATWSLEAPATTYQPTGTRLAVSFVTAMAFEDVDNGWYISQIDASFYRLENGMSTRIGGLPFADGGEGDMTFSADRSFMYFTATGGAFAARLYRVDFDGLFTFIGDVTLPGVAKPLIPGLSLDPISGDLFGVDHSSAALVRIDPTTGEGRIVGPLGSPVLGGGLSFSPSGDLLVLVTGSQVFSVDKETGHTTLRGRLNGINTQAIAIIPEPSTICALFACLVAATASGRRGLRPTTTAPANTG